MLCIFDHNLKKKTQKQTKTNNRVPGKDRKKGTELAYGREERGSSQMKVELFGEVRIRGRRLPVKGDK